MRNKIFPPFGKILISRGIFFFFLALPLLVRKTNVNCRKIISCVHMNKQLELWSKFLYKKSALWNTFKEMEFCYFSLKLDSQEYNPARNLEQCFRVQAVLDLNSGSSTSLAV